MRTRGCRRLEGRGRVAGAVLADRNPAGGFVANPATDRPAGGKLVEALERSRRGREVSDLNRCPRHGA